MFVCTECYHLFDTPKHIQERHGLDTPPYEEMDVCPECYGLAIIDAFCCDECSQYVTGRFIRTGGGQTICDECYTTHDIWEE